jgi:D-alanyl-D-alanine carboxypeptidase/D-alanyl-D-alanine-endopeptidase (penicillin-binding protein 4)
VNTRFAARFATRKVALSALTVALASLSACGGEDSSAQPIPAEIQQIFDKPLYSKATWSLRVVDADSGEVIHDLRSDQRMLIGSVRKLFSVGLALEEIGPDHRFRTPIHRTGNVDGAGVLSGNLVVVASGDLAMGGRTNSDGSFAITNFDHNEANSLQNAVLSAPDPLAGFDTLARQVKARGIARVDGDVVIDERLFEPFDFREEFNLSAMFVNDDVVDVTIAANGAVDWRPRSAAFAVQSGVVVGPAGSAFTVELDPEFPACFGTSGCMGHVGGFAPRRLRAAAHRHVPRSSAPSASCSLRRMRERS